MYSIKNPSLFSICLFYLLFFITPIVGQEVSLKIDSRDLKKYMEQLTSPEFEGRCVGTEGEKKTIHYLKRQLERLGMEVCVEPFIMQESYRGDAYLETIDGKRFTDFETILFQGGDYVNKEEQRYIVFGGTGTEEELTSVEVEGRLVLVFTTSYRTVHECQKLLKGKGANGLILIPEDNPERFESDKRRYKETYLKHHYQMPGYDPFAGMSFRPDTARFLNVLTLSVSEVKNLTGYSRKQLHKFIKDKKIAEVPVVPVKIKYERVRNEIETANVVGVVRGKSEKQIVVSAHYDHLGKSESGYFPGADDNASGIAALLEIAEAFSGRNDLEYTLVFLAAGAEEVGLWGSYAYVNHPDFNVENVLCNINMDMIARTDDQHSRKDKYLYCLGSGKYPQLDGLLKKADAMYDACILDFSLDNTESLHNLFQMTDCYNFSTQGIPAILFISGLHPDYHRPTDTVDKVDFNLLESRVRQIGLVIDLLQSEGLIN